MSCVTDESASAVKKFVPENAAQLNPNDVKGGTAPEQPVQLPPFTTTDQTGQEFGLEQLQVWLPSCASCWLKEENTFEFFHPHTHHGPASVGRAPDRLGSSCCGAPPCIKLPGVSACRMVLQAHLEDDCSWHASECC